MLVLVRSPDGIGPDTEEANHHRAPAESGGPGRDAF